MSSDVNNSPEKKHFTLLMPVSEAMPDGSTQLKYFLVAPESDSQQQQEQSNFDAQNVNHFGGPEVQQLQYQQTNEIVILGEGELNKLFVPQNGAILNQGPNDAQAVVVQQQQQHQTSQIVNAQGMTLYNANQYNELPNQQLVDNVNNNSNTTDQSQLSASLSPTVPLPSQPVGPTVPLDPEKQFQCSVCPKAFPKKLNLTRHMKTHTKPFKCKHCDKAFANSFQLKSHMYYHTRESAYHCDLCDKAFSRPERLEGHKQFVHEKKKPHSCDLCSQTFTRKEDLKRHINIHTKEIQYPCPDCGKVFNTKSALTYHVKTHLEEDPQVCSLCKKLFVRPDRLARHIRRKHKNEAKDLLLPLMPKTNYCNKLDLVNDRLPNEMFVGAVHRLLPLIVKERTLDRAGFPHATIDTTVQFLCQRFNIEPAKPEVIELNHETGEPYYDYEALRHNVKALMLTAVEDDEKRQAIEYSTADEAIVEILTLANI